MTEEEKLNIKKQFCDIIKEGIAPILKSAEFKKNGNNFYAHVGELDWCINMQKRQMGIWWFFKHMAIHNQHWCNLGWLCNVFV